MNIISKFSSSTPAVNQQRAPEPPSPALSPTPKNHGNAPISWNVTGLTVPGTMDTSVMGLSESQLRRQALECLISVLRSLVAWGTAMNRAHDEGGASLAARSEAEEVKKNNSDHNLDRLTVSGGSVETLRQTAPSPDINDDPSRFESARQKKTTLLEGIKKFNQKPKHVCTNFREETISIFISIRVSNSSSRLVSSKVALLKISPFFCTIRMV